MSHLNDPQTNDNENHLIGNILAEENSDSDGEDNKTFSKGVGGGGVGTFSSGTGGPFGLGSSGVFGGAFSTIPDRVGSAPAQEITAKFGGYPQDSPQQKKIQGFGGGGLVSSSQGFTNLFSNQNDTYNSVGVSSHEQMLRRASANDFSQQDAISQMQPQFMMQHQLQQQQRGNLPPSQSMTPVQQHQAINDPYQTQQNQQIIGSSQDSSSVMGGLNQEQLTKQQLQQQYELYSSKEYFDYYNTQKSTNPKLPQPTYQPRLSDMDGFNNQKMRNKNSDDVSNFLNEVQRIKDHGGVQQKLENLKLDDSLQSIFTSQPLKSPIQSSKAPPGLQQNQMLFQQIPQQQNMTGFMNQIPNQQTIQNNMSNPSQSTNNQKQGQKQQQNLGQSQSSKQMGGQNNNGGGRKHKGKQANQSQQDSDQSSKKGGKSNQQNNSSQVAQTSSSQNQEYPGYPVYPMGHPQMVPPALSHSNSFPNYGGIRPGAPGQVMFGSQQNWPPGYGGFPAMGMMNPNQAGFGQNMFSQPQESFGQVMGQPYGLAAPYGMTPQQLGGMGYPYPHMYQNQQQQLAQSQSVGNLPQNQTQGQNKKQHQNQKGGNQGKKNNSKQQQQNSQNSNQNQQQPQNQNQSSLSVLQQQNSSGTDGGQQTIQMPKSAFLEELRHKIQNGVKIEIVELEGHIVECAMDQYGSRFIQQKYDTTTPEEKELIFNEILPDSFNLMNDVFGNYVVQKLFEYGTEQHRSDLADQLLGNVLMLTKSMYGCRVVQKALEVISLDQQNLLVSELKDNVLDCINDQNGNHVIQKCIEKMPCSSIDFIISPVINKTSELCVHTYGCRVIQRILEHSTEYYTRPIIEGIINDIHNLTMDQFGNYVIQHILEHGKSQEDKNKIVKSIKGKVIELSNHKFASNVVEKCLQYASDKDKEELIEEFLDKNFEDETSTLNQNGVLYQMMKDRYGNYVIQKCIEVSVGKQREVLMKRITACANVLKKQANYSRHVYNFIDKMSTDGGSSTNVSMTVSNSSSQKQNNQKNVNKSGENKHSKQQQNQQQTQNQYQNQQDYSNYFSPMHDFNLQLQQQQIASQHMPRQGMHPNSMMNASPQMQSQFYGYPMNPYNQQQMLYQQNPQQQLAGVANQQQQSYQNQGQLQNQNQRGHQNHHNKRNKQ